MTAKPIPAKGTFPFYGHRTQAQVRMDERSPAERLRDQKIFDMTEQRLDRAFIAERLSLSLSFVTRRRKAMGLT